MFGQEQDKEDVKQDINEKIASFNGECIETIANYYQIFP